MAFPDGANEIIVSVDEAVLRVAVMVPELFSGIEELFTVKVTVCPIPKKELNTRKMRPICLKYFMAYTYFGISLSIDVYLFGSYHFEILGY